MSSGAGGIGGYSLLVGVNSRPPSPACAVNADRGVVGVVGLTALSGRDGGSGADVGLTGVRRKPSLVADLRSEKGSLLTDMAGEVSPLVGSGGGGVGGTS